MQKQEKLFAIRGGKRKGAGRKKIYKDLLPHSKRPPISMHYPLHITIKLKPGIKTLRKRDCYKLFRESVKQAVLFGVSVVHYSVQSNHVHLIVESKSRTALACGMKSLCIRLAKGINNIHGTIGKIFCDRYYLHILKTPTEVKEALVYVFKNTAKAIKSKNLFDPFSSILAFKEKDLLLRGEIIDDSILSKEKLAWFREELARILGPPTCFLLVDGWKRSKSLKASIG